MDSLNQNLRLIQKNLEEGFFEQALQQTLSFYESTKKDIYLLFWLGIEMDQGKENRFFYQEIMKKIKKIPFRFRSLLEYRRLQLALMNGKNKEALKSIRFLRRSFFNSDFMDQAYAKICFEIGSEKAIFALEKALQNTDLSDSKRFELVNMWLCFYQKTLEKEEYILSILHQYHNSEYVSFHFFQLSIERKKIEWNWLEQIQIPSLRQKALELILDYFLNEKDFEKGLAYAISIKEKTKAIWIKISEFYYELKRKKECFAIYDEIYQDDSSLLFLKKGAFFQRMGKREDLLNAISFYELAYQKKKEDEILFKIAECFVMLEDKPALKKVLLRIKNQKDGYFHYMKGAYFQMEDRFDKAKKEYHYAYQRETISALSYHLLMNEVAFDPKKDQKAIKVELKRTLDDPLFSRFKALGYLHGNYGFQVNLDMALLEIKKSLNEEQNNGLDLSILGKIYLEKGLYEQAFQIFNQEKDSSSSAPFLAYCYLMGYGTIKNEKKAYLLLDAMLKRKRVDPNTLVLYGYLSIKLNYDLSFCYQVLRKYKKEVRYHLPFYRMMFELEKRLCLKPNKKMLKRSYQYASLNEKIYYASFPLLPFLRCY